MKVIIPGGSGLIGRALAEELSEAGCPVEILSRNPERLSGLPKGTVAREWDSRSPEALAGLISGSSAVVNLVGENIGASRWTEERKALLRRSRVETTKAVVEAFRMSEQRPEVLLQASAVGYYGSDRVDEVIEEAPPGADFLGRLCQEWESASQEIEVLGVRRVLLRTGLVLSRQGGALPRMALPFRLFVGGPIGSGDQCVPWIHIADEVGAIRFLIENKDATGAFNLTAPEIVTNREFSSVLAKTLHRPNLLPAPAPALKLLLGEMSTLALDGQCAVPKRLTELGYEFDFSDLQEALHDIYHR
ncbi:MAG: TIGR01777 family oxidoreductase [Acidobacteriota bacterium]